MTHPLAGARAALGKVLEASAADDAEDHARQVAMVTAILSEAFEQNGLRCTLVGGSAIEVFAPGILKSGDIDLVIESTDGPPTARDRLDPVFADLGFKKAGRHWVRDWLFVEVPSLEMVDPADVLNVGPFQLRVVAKELLLAERISGFVHWKQTAYGQQAVDMLAAFGGDLDDGLMGRYLDREATRGAFRELLDLAGSDRPVTKEVLEGLLQQIKPDSRI